MKLVVATLSFLFLISCAVEDNYVQFQIEQVFSDNLEQTIKVDIIYVQSSVASSQSSYNLDETAFIQNLNGSFFHRYGIGLEIGDIQTLINDELYDLRDNSGEESRVFLAQTQDLYNKNRMNIYIMKRSHTDAIAGIGKNQRALITDEFLFTATAPHEIGHALGLFHSTIEGNVMSKIRPHMRKDFTNAQVDQMKNAMKKIEEF
ncbi:matrixin family metalloprotease [uncultured Aquimarina sp.]|uniref:matrixin family metalloprotease n=1 Tax=uncultured Aquimarina sp. TaxID=575652 RepID=UPI0026274EE6|nr:matrixin family metalloprotease [uncultured Aquimarina sp.]